MRVSLPVEVRTIPFTFGMFVVKSRSLHSLDTLEQSIVSRGIQCFTICSLHAATMARFAFGVQRHQQTVEMAVASCHHSYPAPHPQHQQPRLHHRSIIMMIWLTLTMIGTFHRIKLLPSLSSFQHQHNTQTHFYLKLY